VAPVLASQDAQEGGRTPSPRSADRTGRQAAERTAAAAHGDRILTRHIPGIGHPVRDAHPGRPESGAVGRGGQQAATDGAPPLSGQASSLRAPHTTRISYETPAATTDVKPKPQVVKLRKPWASRRAWRHRDRAGVKTPMIFWATAVLEGPIPSRLAPRRGPRHHETAHPGASRRSQKISHGDVENPWLAPSLR
jgi:hypothetical protein